MFEQEMKIRTTKWQIMILASILLGFAGQNATASENIPTLGMPNPANMYCYDMGYDVSMVKTEAGESSYCLFPDGTQCGTWEFLDGMCGTEFSICAESGYDLVVEPGGQFSFYTAYCVDGDIIVGSVIALAGLENRSTSTTPEEVAQNSTTMTISLPAGYRGNIKDIVGSPNTDNADVSMPVGYGDIDFSWHSITDPSSNYMSAVKDQAHCGSCWAFSAVGVVEAAYSVFYDNPWMKLDLAEEYLNSDCYSAGSCCGGNAGEALGVFESDGIPDETCMPYVDDYKVSDDCNCYGNKKKTNSTTATPGCPAECPNNTDNACSFTACNDKFVGETQLTGALCSDVDQRSVYIDGVGHVTVENGQDSVSIDKIKQALRDYGPLSVSYAASADRDPTTGVFDCDDCWRDNPTYEEEDTDGTIMTTIDTDEDCLSAGVCNSDGVCESGHVGAVCENDDECFNDVDGNGICDVEDCAVNHAVIITGWSDSLQAWEVKNSWGDIWNGDGYFLLRYDDCHIQKNVFYPIISSDDTLPITAFSMESPIVISGDVLIRDRAYVEGNIALGGDLQMFNDSAMSGSVYVEGAVDMGDRVTFTGDVVAGETVTKGHDTTISGVEVSNSDYDFTSMDIVDVTYDGTESIIVGHDEERVLFPGSYQSLNVYDRGKVVLQSGDYYFSYISLNNDTTFVSENPGDDVRIFVDYGVATGDRVSLGANGSTGRFQILSNWDFALFLGKNQTSIQYVDVLAPSAQIWVANNAKIYGSLIGRYLSVGNDAIIYGL